MTPGSAAIDRHAVVSRHDVRRQVAEALEPLTVGNGEFAFTVDVTGLQTLTDLHDEVAGRRDDRPAMGLHSQAQWGFHEMPNPNGWGLDDVMRPYRTPRGPVDYPVAYDFDTRVEELTEDELAGYYLWVNPQRLDLFRLGLELRPESGADPLPADGVEDRLDRIDQRLELWTGIIESRFSCAGVDYRVRTACHPDRDLLAIRISSAALADQRATVRLAFPGASDTFADTADWDHPDRHRTELAADPGDWHFLRTLDETHYQSVLTASPGTTITDLGAHAYRIAGSGSALELVLWVGPGHNHPSATLPSVDEVFAASAKGWQQFWTSGAAIDFGQCADPRAAELERRVVLSQYLTRAQSAGSTPPAEGGLTQNAWAGKFHLEMHWWHAAHFPLWGRPELLEPSLDWYLSIMPMAREIASRQGFPGVRWPKHVGPDGREAPNVIGPLLLWQQPHPIHFAELIRLARPDQRATVIERYGELVDETARFIAGYLLRGDDGLVHLPPAVMPAQERYEPETVWDPPFELTYFAWGLRTAQHWRSWRGLPAEPGWQQLLDDLAPLPVDDDHFAAVGGPPRTELSDHPSMVGALGVVPDIGIVDHRTMINTLDFIDAAWDWDATWGWDYPMIAMTASRLGAPDRAIDVLTRSAPRNRYLANGHNCQHPTRLPAYLPGNGGLLAAIALMATHRDGFPNQGWDVRAEGFPEHP